MNKNEIADFKKVMLEREKYRFLLGFLDRHLDTGATIFNGSLMHKVIKETRKAPEIPGSATLG